MTQPARPCSRRREGLKSPVWIIAGGAAGGVGGVGITWGVQREFVDRLLVGYDARLGGALYGAEGLAGLAMQITLDRVTLQGSVELAGSLVEMTIGAQRFIEGICGVGGSVDAGRSPRRIPVGTAQGAERSTPRVARDRRGAARGAMRAGGWDQGGDVHRLQQRSSRMQRNVKISLPNSGHLQNIQGFLKRCSAADTSRLDFAMDSRWVSVHPAVLAMTACAAAVVKGNGGTVYGKAEKIGSLPYLIRMGLFDYLGLDPGRTIEKHDPSGRFIPLTQIRTSDELKQAIVSLVPLLHAQPEEADSIRYVFSELARNVLEHSNSPVGAFVCAQYYKETKRVSIGIADAGIGIRQSMAQSHPVETPRDAMVLALQPGVTGTTARFGGTAANAGAGLFFVKSIAALSRNFFVLYSDDCMFKLLRGSAKKDVALHADPRHDNHLFATTLPHWQGTVVGIDISMKRGQQFSALLAAIRNAYFGDVKAKKRDYYKRIRFK